MSEFKKLLLAQTGYSGWATNRVLRACSALSLHQLDSELGASHSSILSTLRHIHDGELVWLDRLGTDGEWRLPQGPVPERSFEFLLEAWPKLWSGYRDWIEAASDGDLTSEFTTLLPAEAKLRGPRWQIVLHVVNHSTLHRGQIITMLRALGCAPPNIDLMSYYVIS